MTLPIRNILAATFSTIGFVGLPHNALAFDCAKATTDTEKAICGNAALKALDEAMIVAYDKVRADLPESERAGLVTSQRNFITKREYCGGGEGALSCIIDNTQDRVSFLSGALSSGALISDAPALMPYFVQQVGDAKKGLHTVDHSVVLFAKPTTKGEDAYNAAARDRADDAPLEVNKDMAEFTPENAWESFIASRFTLLTSDIISAEMTYYTYEGGAHGLGGVSSISFDRLSGTELSVPALLGAAGMVALQPICREQIMSQKVEKFGNYDANESYKVEEDTNYSDTSLADGLRLANSWRLEPGKSTVTYGAYQIGSYAEGSFECVFPNAMLNALSGGKLNLP
jgi:uncharacterized protein